MAYNGEFYILLHAKILILFKTNLTQIAKFNTESIVASKKTTISDLTGGLLQAKRRQRDVVVEMAGIGTFLLGLSTQTVSCSTNVKRNRSVGNFNVFV